MPYQVHDALPHAMSGTELSRVRTELRLLPREPIKHVCSRRGGPALLCNEVLFHVYVRGGAACLVEDTSPLSNLCGSSGLVFAEESSA